MASSSGLTSKTKSIDAFACMCVRVMNFVQKKGSACREVRECVSRSQRASVEKSRCIREQNESCEKENRVYREL